MQGGHNQSINEAGCLLTTTSASESLCCSIFQLEF